MQSHAPALPTAMFHRARSGSARRSATALRTALSLLLMATLSQCGRTQNAGSGAADTLAAADSVRSRQRMEEKHRALAATLDTIAASARAAGDGEEIDRLILATYNCSRTLTTIVRTMDRNDLYADDIREEERRFAREDSTRAGKSGKILNGMLGVYSTYALISRMRFSGDPAHLAALEAIEKRVVATMRPDIPAIEALAAMANGVYHMSRDLVWSFSGDSSLAEGFDVIDENFRNGEQAAESDEDRFLNAIYRSFEVCQLWALLLNPAQRQEISTLSRDMFTEVKKADTIERQMTVSMDYYQRIHALIARRMLAAAE